MGKGENFTDNVLRFSSWGLVIQTRKPALQSPLLLAPSKEVYSSCLSLTHTLRTSHFLTPGDPSTPMCVTQGGDSQRWRWRHKGTQAISICLCPPAFSPLCVSSRSLPLWPLQPVAMWPIDPWLDWSLTAIKALSYFTVTATGQYMSWICLKYFKRVTENKGQ